MRRDEILASLQAQHSGVETPCDKVRLSWNGSEWFKEEPQEARDAA